jgi:hypothetical protein
MFLFEGQVNGVRNPHYARVARIRFGTRQNSFDEHSETSFTAVKLVDFVDHDNLVVFNRSKGFY